jgi:hypothetical protein
MARLNVSLTNDMARKIQDSADSDGKTISSVITESVDLCFHLKELGISREQLVKMIEYQRFTKSINAVPIPALLLDPMLNIAIENAHDRVVELWCESGKVAGELIKNIEPDIRKLADRFREYSLFTPLTRMEIKSSEDTIEFLLMGTGYSVGAARITAEAMKCFLGVYGIKDMKETISEGFVKVVGRMD